MFQTLSLKDWELGDQMLGEKLLKTAFGANQSAKENLRPDAKLISDNPFIQWERIQYLLRDVGHSSSEFVRMPSLPLFEKIIYVEYEESGFKVELLSIPAAVDADSLIPPIQQSPALIVFRVWDMHRTFYVRFIKKLNGVWNKDPKNRYIKDCESMGITPYEHICT